MVLFYIIVTTSILVFAFGSLTVMIAWDLGNKFYIKGNKGRKRNWLERLFNGFEILNKM